MRDSGQPDWRCGEVAWQFQFPDAMLDRPVRELSGGWQTRTKLAALLLHDPEPADPRRADELSRPAHADAAGAFPAAISAAAA